VEIFEEEEDDDEDDDEDENINEENKSEVMFVDMNKNNDKQPQQHKEEEEEELPKGWEKGTDARGKIYFIDHNTQTTTWRDPRKKKFSEYRK